MQAHTKHKNLILEKNKQNHLIWTLVRKPFPIPTWATHKHEWEIFDIDQAGCLLCGYHHICDTNTCEYAQCEDGSRVCRATGYCIPCIQVSCTEYSECNTTQLTKKLNTHEQRLKLYDLIHTYVLQILGSEAVQTNLHKEHQISQARKTFTLQRICRNMKSQDEFDIFKCSAHLAHETRHLRETLTLKDNDIEEISSKCSSAIVRFVNALELFPTHTNETKLFYHTVGLLYLMRQGITCNNTALLTRISILKNILPQENHIKAVFNVRAKVITETENMVKMCMRKLSSIHDVINIHYSTV